MEPKLMLTKRIPVHLAPFEAWKKLDFTPELIAKCKDFLPGDIIREFKYTEKTIEPGMGFMNQDEEDTIYSAPTIIVERKVLETDDEYVIRLRDKEKARLELEKREHLEYLRLKAKFEQ